MGQPSASVALLGAGAMFVAGVSVPVQSAMNANVGRILGNPMAAMVLQALIGFLFSAVVLGFTGMPSWSRLNGLPWPYWTAGLLTCGYVLAMTVFAPRIGVGTAVMFVLLGQMAAALVVDHFGLMGALKTEVTLARMLGVTLMVVGVLLARRAA